MSSSGVTIPASVESACGDGADLVTIMVANNDTGVMQPVAEIAEIAHAKGAVVHTDAVQAVGKIPVSVDSLGVELLSFSSHKIGGPKGAGALYVQRGTKLAAHLFGGHQERRLRAGTENVPAIVGFGKACELAAGRLAEDAKAEEALRERLCAGILAAVP